MERLDKIIARELNIPRSEAKLYIKQGRVTLNGIPAHSGDNKCDAADAITVDGKCIRQKEFVYIMLHKPKGVVCATADASQTVMDMLPPAMQRKGLFPAGRLDKDTTGFVLITDDGALAHRLLAPKSHVDKRYEVWLDKPVSKTVQADFENGMRLGERQLLPAELTVIGNEDCHVHVVLRQGIFHQIKRMFQKHGLRVLALKRVAIGAVLLDETLPEGACRYLTDEEIARLKNAK